MAKIKIPKPVVIDILLVILGSIILAFGTSIFLIESNIVAGGLSGIGIIIENIFKIKVDVLVIIMSWVLFFIGLIILGPKFALNTLVSTIVYPLALFFFTRVSFFQTITTLVNPIDKLGNIDYAIVLINGLFGGAFVGLGVAITFLGHGSTGGVDIIYFIVYKYLKIKESITSFIVDALIILVAMFVLNNDYFISCLVGVLSALMSALLINFIYNSNKKQIMVEVVSTRYPIIAKNLSDSIKNEILVVSLDEVKDLKMLRFTIENDKYTEIRNHVLALDPHARVSSILHAHNPKESNHE